MPVYRIAALACFGLLLQACGGGGSKSTPPPPPPTNTVTINYLRVEPAYDGWGLHLWGSAIDASVATTWNSPRNFDRVENGAAVFEIPVVNLAGDLNLVVHNGDLTSPVFDLTLVPQNFAAGAWVVQDTVASLSGNIGSLFNNEADALAALNVLGNASATLDLSTVVVNDMDSGLPCSSDGSNE